VENRDASLDYLLSIRVLLRLDCLPATWQQTRSGKHSALGVYSHRAASSEEEGRRLKERTVILVVSGGKVEILPKRLWERELTGKLVFQIQAVQFCAFGNPVRERSNDTWVPHISHR
jgi:hypothetical protein